MPISDQEALLRCIEHRELFHDEMLELWRRLMSGQMSPVMIASITAALRVKKETIGEISAAAQVMRELALKVPITNTSNLVDIVGTGGDSSHTFNISTTAMFVIAAAGAKVAKHGGRSVSSSSGSADVLEVMGANIMLQPQQVASCLDQTNIGFMFAPNHHAAMKYAAPIRKELGVRTIFNLLGPLTNPAGAPHTLMGVFHADLVGIQTRVLQRLGARHAVVVYGVNNLDEVSLSGATMVGELKDGKITEYQIHPEDYGLPVYGDKQLKVDGPIQSQEKMLEALSGKDGAPRDIVIFNAGVALYAADLCATIQEGIAMSREAVMSGAARAKLEQFVKVTQSFKAA